MHRHNSVAHVSNPEFRFNLSWRASGILVTDYIVPTLPHKGHPGVLGVLGGHEVKQYYTLQRQLAIECAELRKKKRESEFVEDDLLLLELCDLAGRHVRFGVVRQYRVLLKKPFSIREGWTVCREDFNLPERAAEARIEAQSPKAVTEPVSTRSEHCTVGQVIHYRPPSAPLNI